MTTFSRKFEEKTDIWTVFVRGTHGEILTLSDMKASSRGSKVHYSLSAKTGIPHTRMRLMRGTMMLKPCATLAASGLENECTIDLHIPGCGGGRGLIDDYFVYVNTMLINYILF